MAISTYPKKNNASQKIRVGYFWKILIIFWLIFIAIFTFNFFVTHIYSDTIRFRPIPPHLHDQLEGIKHRLDFLLHKRQAGGRRERKARGIYLINSKGEDYFGKKIPEVLKQLDERVIEERVPLTALRQQTLYFGGIPFNIQRKTYHIYMIQQFGLMSRGYFSFFFREFAHTLLLTTLLISFPLSFLLAWFFTRPIKKLQTAIAEMSDDLNHRDSLLQLTKRRDEFGELATDFDGMADHLDKIINSKTRLLGDVSHELKSPLARLQIALGLAFKKQTNDQNELERIKLETDRMNQMISGLLDYSKLDSSSLFSEHSNFNLSSLLSSLVEDCSFESQQKNIAIESLIQPDVILNGNQVLLTSCFENILRNAIRYAKQSIQVECQKDSQSSSICVVIRDDGKGVQQDKLVDIFEAFYRPEEDRSRQSGGVGLGLSIAKKAVQVHQGEIFAKNISPQGFEVIVKLPTHS